MTLRVTTRKVSDVARFVKRQFGDEAGVQITDADIYDWINSAQLEICDRNRIITSQASTDVISGQADYTLTSLNIISITSIHYKGGILPCVEFAQAEQIINEATGGTGELASVPVLWYEWDNKITLWPTPTEDTTDGLTVYYNQSPTDVTALTDFLSVPDRYFRAVCSYCMAQAYELDEAFSESDAQMQYFTMALDVRNEEERTAAEVTYPSITIVE